jgi:hypothetical protein
MDKQIWHLYLTRTAIGQWIVRAANWLPSADLEIGDTAGWETCGTGRGFMESLRGLGETGAHRSRLKISLGRRDACPTLKFMEKSQAR